MANNKWGGDALVFWPDPWKLEPEPEWDEDLAGPEYQMYKLMTECEDA